MTENEHENELERAEAEFVSSMRRYVEATSRRLVAGALAGAKSLEELEQRLGVYKRP